MSNQFQLSLILIFVSIFATACSSTTSDLLSSEDKNSRYQVEDKGEKYLFVKSDRYLKNKNQFMTKSELLSQSEEFRDKSQDESTLESSVAISTPGKMNGAALLRPYLAQHHVWFDGKRYSTEMILNSETKKLDVKLRSPEAKWNGNKSYALPKGSGAYCFYSQIVECISYTGFFKKAAENEGGTMNLHILWDSFPYFMDQYPGIALSPFAAATVQYDGLLDKEFYRFVVEHNDQTFYLIFDKKYQLVKQLWVSQGLTIERE